MAEGAVGRNALKNLIKNPGFSVCHSSQLKISRLEQTDLRDNLLEAFESSDDYADVSLVAENQAVPFHRSVIAASSPFLAATLGSVQCPCQTITIIIDGCRYVDILRVKHLLYFGEVKLTEAEMVSFLAVTKLLGFKVPIGKSVSHNSEPDLHAMGEPNSTNIGTPCGIETKDESPEVLELVGSQTNQRSAKQEVQRSAAKVVGCDLCPSIFSTQAAYKTHMQNSHGESRKRSHDEIEVIFSECAEMIPSAHNASKANKEKKSSGSKLQRYCSICSRKFPMRDWDDHMAQHALKGEKPSTPLPNEYECPQCKKAFTLTWGTRVNNLRILKQLDCHLCGEKFSNVSNLRRHVRRTHSCRPHLLCDTCDPALPPLESDSDNTREQSREENEAAEGENDEDALILSSLCFEGQVEIVRDSDS